MNKHEKEMFDREFKNLNLVINASPEVIREIHFWLTVKEDGPGLTRRNFKITNRDGAPLVLNVSQDDYEYERE
jgi:hypothetical protein